MTLDLVEDFEPLFEIRGERGVVGHAYDEQIFASGKVTKVVSTIVSIRGDEKAVVKNVADDNGNRVRVCALVDENVPRIFNVPTDARQKDGGCTITGNAEQDRSIIFQIVFHVEVWRKGLKNTS